ncbi:MAG TPA: hypothetical protein VK917_07505 [Ilumatobacter sp.]|nr:hypothetical protein [Ilumatobacter sp.]
MTTDAQRVEPNHRPTARTQDRPTAVYHFSEDSTLRRFAPHVPPSNPSHPPAVWAIDAEHAPLYWFPRMVPRISVWAYDDEQQRILTERFATESHRICAAEQTWLDEIRSARVYRYTFDASEFEPWEQADGQYVAFDVVYPQEIEVVDDLLRAHCEAGVELRLAPRLGALMDAILASGLPFSFVRIRDAQR